MEAFAHNEAAISEAAVRDFLRDTRGVDKPKCAVPKRNAAFKKDATRHPCDGCEAPFAVVQLCAKCKRAQYCGKDCQLGHWKTHKHACKAFAAGASAADAAAAVAAADSAAAATSS